MSTAPLGRLKRIDLREAWPNEALNFTPWLALPENIALLGEAIGAELEPHAEEQRVGPFRADILCRESGTDAWVLIENQLERTDHNHLGQLLTYAAGLNTVTVVWVAERFTDEHRAALDWLNQKTPDDIAFFGLEVELWKIGNSQPAPKFNVVCKPNVWTRQITASTDTSETKAFCWDYWSGVLAEIEPSGILLPETKPLRRQDTRFDVGWHTFFLKAYFSRVKKKKLGVWVSCRGPHGFENYLALKEQRQKIETAFGGTLEWQPEEDRDQGTLIHYIYGYDANDRADWPRQHKLIAEKVVALYHAVKPCIEPLDNQAEETTNE
jgi:hypothetical protein